MVNDREGTLYHDFMFVQLSNLNSMNDCIYITLAVQCSLSTLMGWVESFYLRRSLFALYIAHCLRFEHSGDSTMQSFNV